MSSPVPFLPPVLETISRIVTSRAIPELNEIERSDVTQYLFKCANKPLRLAIAEIAYRNHKQPHALDLFLSCAMPLAQRWAVRKAHSLFVYPSDWQLECFYNGAVSAMLKTFQNPFPLRDEPDAFRRFLPYRFACGAIEAYFTRYENHRMETVENVELAVRPNLTRSNAIEQELIARDLLEKIAEYPLLQRGLSKTLHCIRELGPDVVLKERHWAEARNPERSKKGFAGRPMLNAEAISKARGVSPAFVLGQISMARRILRKAFNGDGRLFVTH
jgi:hypothetical protein